MKPLVITAISTAVIGAIFLLVTTLEWPDDGFFNPDIRLYVAGASIGSALITIAIGAALLAMHAKAVGDRTLDALRTVESEHMQSLRSARHLEELDRNEREAQLRARTVQS